LLTADKAQNRQDQSDYKHPTSNRCDEFCDRNYQKSSAKNAYGCANTSCYGFSGTDQPDCGSNIAKNQNPGSNADKLFLKDTPFNIGFYGYG
jgi:hypothetical protein